MGCVNLPRADHSHKFIDHEQVMGETAYTSCYLGISLV